MYASTTEQRREAQVQALADQLYRERHPYLLRTALKNAAGPEDAEEALQDAFVLFIDHFDPSGEAPAIAWLALTLKRRCWAIYGHQRRDPGRGRGGISQSTPGADTVADPRRQPDEIAEVTERVEWVRAQLAELKPAERRALGLIGAGNSYREVGEITGWTYTKINRCLSEGRAALRSGAPLA